jgi:hypothetical protein
MRSAVEAPLAAAWVMASRSEPGQLSEFVVTVNVVARAEQVQVKRSRVRENFIAWSRYVKL